MGICVCFVVHIWEVCLLGQMGGYYLPFHEYYDVVGRERRIYGGLYTQLLC